MKKLIPICICVLTLSFNPSFAKAPAKLKYSVDFLFQYVLKKKNQTKNDSIPFPPMYVESSTPLKQFQDALESQWGMRPAVFSNAFAVKNNELYISDDAAYYEKHGRCMDDSVVHELAHYVQVKYLNWDLSDESLEWDAVEIQTNFREEFCPLKSEDSRAFE